MPRQTDTREDPKHNVLHLMPRLEEDLNDAEFAVGILKS